MSRRWRFRWMAVVVMVLALIAPAGVASSEANAATSTTTHSAIMTDAHVRAGALWREQGALGPVARATTPARTVVGRRARAYGSNAPKAAPNFVGPVRQSSHQIGHGHAFNKHVVKKGEFPEVSTPDDLARVVERVRTHGTHQRSLTQGRRAFYDAHDNTLVIRNPNSKDGGTVFRPDDGLDYFNDLK